MMSKKYICIENLQKTMMQQFTRHQDDLNVITGYIHLRKYDKVLDYVKERSDANCSTYSLKMMKNLELAVLLENKLAEGERKRKSSFNCLINYHICYTIFNKYLSHCGKYNLNT
ncbi:hypothetical protein [Wukongibacter sp. M2B1]|uniref:hypothetical protein n=1 Tax=Wukongibacter sp. M2B1 TaxID=3088895 RepID=UPI003D7BEB50